MTLQPPRIVLALTAATAVPFVALAAGVLSGRGIGAGPALYALQICGAVVLSTLGGIDLGVAASNPRQGSSRLVDFARVVAGIAAPVLSWMGVWMAGSRGLWLLASGFLIFAVLDWIAASDDATRLWFARSRLLLSAVAAASLAAAALFGPF